MSSECSDFLADIISMMEKDIKPLLFRDAAEWRSWLVANHANAKEVWVVHWKAKSSASGLRYGDALEEALAYGWIDSMMKSLDKDRVIQRYTPRQPNSNWSESNKARADKLILNGRMTEAGLAAVEAAKKLGKW